MDGEKRVYPSTRAIGRFADPGDERWGSGLDRKLLQCSISELRLVFEI